jgi:hypothetical protein
LFEVIGESVEQDLYSCNDAVLRNGVEKSYKVIVEDA